MNDLNDSSLPNAIRVLVCKYLLIKETEMVIPIYIYFQSFKLKILSIYTHKIKYSMSLFNSNSFFEHFDGNSFEFDVVQLQNLLVQMLNYYFDPSLHSSSNCTSCSQSVAGYSLVR